ncbi:MAG: FecR family protein [Chitinophagaceae bacterium]|nr:FecR family protein [Chitinophagaceae bacterium]
MKANENHMNDELLVKYLLGEANPAERMAVDQWIDASQENTRYFDHFQLIWETSKQLVIPPTVNAEDAWLRFQQRTGEASKKPAVVRKINTSFSWMRVAAIVIATIGVIALTYFLSGRPNPPTTVATLNNPKSDTLPDGSFVMLNKNSSISYTRKFKGNKRKVDLKGEAFFTVTPNKEKPFEISVNGITVTVVGTSFNIKSMGGKTEVVVETGVVKVTRNRKTVELRPNEKLITSTTDSTLVKEKVTDKLHQYYRSKEFVCDNTPLWKLVEVLNEVYDANIIVERNELRSLPLTTTFYNESLDKILSVIAETFEITVEKKENQIILK